ncbi:hypothetical protein FH972_008431 [Carpinus fangiana]|uniref:Uncharacterized protein n=1 Tax=Carpinus fangiana TaxID=176857 RepID=A0A5N6QZJ0_9ROSI|nr:hypothetical protein FH972_008431 [Carpinus fangiana]
MDPSNSFESQAFVNANQVEQTETITCMSCDSYNAAAKGNIDFFKAITNQSLDLLRTPNKNTTLHIYITALDSESKSTRQLSMQDQNQQKPSMQVRNQKPPIQDQSQQPTLWKKFLKCVPHCYCKPIPKVKLHCTLRQGTGCAQTLHDQDLEEGIEPVKEMLRMTNKEKDTALHNAVRYNHLEVVWSEEFFKKIEGISREVDNNGWTPLHLVAYLGYGGIAVQLLDKDREVAYMKDTKGRTPLHIAAQHGYYVNAMKVIVERCPDCCELVDNRGCNVLHFALKGQNSHRCLERFMEIIKEKMSLSKPFE